MRRAGGVVVALLVLALPAAAGAPVRSPHPQLRALPDQLIDLRIGEMAAATAPAPAPAAPIRQYLRPAVRPVSAQVLAAAARPAGPPFLGPARSVQPKSRPGAMVLQAMAKRQALRQGAICGDLDIQGDHIGRVPGRIGACDIDDAVRVRSVAGVGLSQPAVISCETARALRSWVVKGVKPAFRQRGPVVELKVAAHYVCRTRNNQPGAKVSEHGRGRAIDISGFTMKDGEVVTVLKGWGQGTTLRLLNQTLKAACGPFGTVLGPRSDGYHRDHFHLDVADYRGGPYCR